MNNCAKQFFFESRAFFRANKEKLQGTKTHKYPQHLASTMAQVSFEYVVLEELGYNEMERADYFSSKTNQWKFSTQINDYIKNNGRTPFTPMFPTLYFPPVKPLQYAINFNWNGENFLRFELSFRNFKLSQGNISAKSKLKISKIVSGAGN